MDRLDLYVGVGLVVAAIGYALFRLFHGPRRPRPAGSAPRANHTYLIPLALSLVIWVITVVHFGGNLLLWLGIWAAIALVTFALGVLYERTIGWRIRRARRRRRGDPR